MKKKDHAVIHDMMNLCGFTWNDTTKRIEVDNDETWKTYVQI